MRSTDIEFLCTLFWIASAVWTLPVFFQPLRPNPRLVYFQRAWASVLLFYLPGIVLVPLFTVLIGDGEYATVTHTLLFSSSGLMIWPILELCEHLNDVSAASLRAVYPIGQTAILAYALFRLIERKAQETDWDAPLELQWVQSKYSKWIRYIFILILLIVLSPICAAVLGVVWFILYWEDPAL